MEKLKLKHLAPYLPYKLKCKVIDRNYELMGYAISELNAVYSNGECVFHGLVESDQGFKSVKPILRPLSDLTKEIEINGSKFIPMFELLDCSEQEKNDFEVYGTIPLHWDYALKVSIPNDWIYRDTEMLFKWHFDVFGLIEKGLAIDINALKQNPYCLVGENQA